MAWIYLTIAGLFEVGLDAGEVALEGGEGFALGGPGVGHHGAAGEVDDVLLEPSHKLRSFPRKRESSAVTCVPAFAGTNGQAATQALDRRKPLARLAAICICAVIFVIVPPLRSRS